MAGACQDRTKELRRQNFSAGPTRTEQRRKKCHQDHRFLRRDRQRGRRDRPRPLFGRAGAEVSLAYVRHSRGDRPRQAEAEAGAAGPRHRAVRRPSTRRSPRDRPLDPRRPRALAAEQKAPRWSSSARTRTPRKGHVSIGNSAQRLLEGGPFAVAIAPAGSPRPPGSRRAADRRGRRPRRRRRPGDRGGPGGALGATGRAGRRRRAPTWS